MQNIYYQIKGRMIKQLTIALSYSEHNRYLEEEEKKAISE